MFAASRGPAPVGTVSAAPQRSYACTYSRHLTQRKRNKSWTDGTLRVSIASPISAVLIGEHGDTVEKQHGLCARWVEMGNKGELQIGGCLVQFCDDITDPLTVGVPTPAPQQHCIALQGQPSHSPAPASAAERVVPSFTGHRGRDRRRPLHCPAPPPPPAPQQVAPPPAGGSWPACAPAAAAEQGSCLGGVPFAGGGASGQLQQPFQAQQQLPQPFPTQQQLLQQQPRDEDLPQRLRAPDVPAPQQRRTRYLTLGGCDEDDEDGDWAPLQQPQPAPPASSPQQPPPRQVPRGGGCPSDEDEDEDSWGPVTRPRPAPTGGPGGGVQPAPQRPAAPGSSREAAAAAAEADPEDLAAVWAEDEGGGWDEEAARAADAVHEEPRRKAPAPPGVPAESPCWPSTWTGAAPLPQQPQLPPSGQVQQDPVRGDAGPDPRVRPCAPPAASVPPEQHAPAPEGRSAVPAATETARQQWQQQQQEVPRAPAADASDDDSWGPTTATVGLEPKTPGGTQWAGSSGSGVVPPPKRQRHPGGYAGTHAAPFPYTGGFGAGEVDEDLGDLAALAAM